MLTRVTGRVDCFGCVCALLCVLCVLMFVYHYTVCYLTCIFYTVVRQISMLFIDNKDSILYVRVSWTYVRACLVDLRTCVSRGLTYVRVSWTYVHVRAFVRL